MYSKMIEIVLGRPKTTRNFDITENDLHLKNMEIQG